MLIPATPFDEARRLQALRSLAPADTEPEERFDRITRTAARLFGVPIALVTLVDDGRLWFKSNHGLEAREISRDISFCGHAILGTETLVVPDALKDPRFADNPLVLGPPHIRFYAGFPLAGPGGQNLGTLCLISPEPRGFAETDRQQLRDLAAWAELELNQASLAQTQEELRRTEARYRMVTDSSTEFTACCDESGRFHFLTPAFQRELGFALEEALGRPATDFVHVQDREGLGRFFKGLTTGAGPDLFTYRALHKDGHEVWLESRGAALKDDQGNLVDTVINTRNVSERMAAERMKQEFVSIVSHELRTPLTSIRGSLGLLAGKALGELPPRAVDLVAIAQTNAERLARLVDDILDLDKVESGKMSFNLQPCELGIAALRAMDSVHAYAQSMGTGVAVDTLPADAWVLGDPERIVQVLLNLLANAIKYSPKGTAVRLRVEAREPWWRIEVENQGPGIPEAFQGAIFHKFAQTGPLDTRQNGGTGLGLSIAHALVRGMGGQIGFTSVPGSTVFWVDLPAARPEAAPAPSAKPLVLVVEDDPLTARLLEAVLMKEGFEVHKAATAAEAKALLDQHAYHAMTLDLLLPDQHGLKLLEELRQRPDTQNLPVLVASSAAEAGKESPGVPALHVLEWMQKPLDPFRVAQALATLETPHARPTVLHVEDDLDVHRVLYAVLEGSTTLLHAPTLLAARKILLSTPVDLVILDSHLPDGRGADLIPDVHAAGGPTLPILFFSGEEGESTLADEVSRTLHKSSASNLDIQRVVQSLLREH
ncbi:MAG: response regulator [Holophagaceae bacterium]|nr:response regulator [Holophagaceae bacterium]